MWVLVSFKFIAANYYYLLVISSCHVTLLFWAHKILHISNFGNKIYYVVLCKTTCY